MQWELSNIIYDIKQTLTVTVYVRYDMNKLTVTCLDYQVII